MNEFTSTEIRIQREALRSQIVSELANVSRTMDIRYSRSDRMEKRHKIVKFIQIVLYTITFSGVLDIALSLDLLPISPIFLTIPTVLLTFTQITTWMNNYPLQAYQEYNAAERLSLVKKQYDSLLVDFNIHSLSDIRNTRNTLHETTHLINSSALRIDRKWFR